MLEWFLLALAVLWLFLAISKTTGFKEGEVVREVVAVLFFMFGIFHLIIAVFFAGSVSPLGSLVNETQNVTYYYSVQNRTHWDVDHPSGGVLGWTLVDRLDNKTVEVGFAYNDGGMELLSFLGYAYAVMLFIYLFLFSMSLFKREVGRGKFGKEDKEY